MLNAIWKKKALQWFQPPMPSLEWNDPFPKKYQGLYPALLIADTLKLFGQGTKVAVEISIMAADAGALSGNDIVAIGGTIKGVDTALIIRPANQSDIFTDLRIREIICKPRTWG